MSRPRKSGTNAVAVRVPRVLPVRVPAHPAVRAVTFNSRGGAGSGGCDVRFAEALGVVAALETAGWSCVDAALDLVADCVPTWAGFRAAAGSMCIDK